MPDYNNPFSANGVNTNFDGNSGGPGFVNQWTTMEQTEKNEQAKPFIEMARQAQELDLQKKKQETGEFMGQEQTQLRAKKVMKEGQQIDADIQRINPTLARDLQKLQQEMDLSPFEMEAKKVQAMEIARNLKGKPAQEFITEAADYYNAFSKTKADPLTQAASYKEFLDGFKAKHPDTVVPPNMEVWSENLGKYLGLARMSSLMSVAHEQDMEKQELVSKTAIEGHKIAAGGTVAAARVASEGAMDREELKAGGKQGAAETRLQEAINNTYKNDPVLQTLGISMLGKSQEEQDAIQTRVDTRRKQLREEIQADAHRGNPGGDAPAVWNADKQKRLDELRRKLGKN